MPPPLPDAIQSKSENENRFSFVWKQQQHNIEIQLRAASLSQAVDVQLGDISSTLQPDTSFQTLHTGAAEQFELSNLSQDVEYQLRFRYEGGVFGPLMMIKAASRAKARDVDTNASNNKDEQDDYMQESVSKAKAAIRKVIIKNEKQPWIQFDAHMMVFFISALLIIVPVISFAVGNSSA